MAQQQDTLNTLLKELSRIDYIKPGEFPNIDLYMDQVTTFMNSHLAKSKIKADDKILTKTMINNYAKNNLLPPPVKKKYSKEHMIVLIFIYYFKNILTISEIEAMLGPLTDHFFDPSDNSGHIDMEAIYTEVYNSVKEQLSTVKSDLETKHAVSKEHFEDVKDRNDRKFLQTFSLICILSYDVYLKKQLIRELIDSFSPKDEVPKKDTKKDTKTTPQK